MFVWQLLDFWPAWRLWRSLHFAPHLMMIAIILVGQVSCCDCLCCILPVLLDTVVVTFIPPLNNCRNRRGEKHFTASGVGKLALGEFH